MNRHAIGSAALSALALAAVGCSLHKSSGTLARVTGSNSYNATASVGDFVNISVDEVAQRITYTNRSTGQHGTVAYAIASDGSYTIDPSSDVADDGSANSDPMGLTNAYEVPGYAFILSAQTTGPLPRSPAIVTAVQSQPIDVADMPGSYNYMQFRTNSGGVEIGDVHIDASDIMPSSYSPGQGGSQFHHGMMPTASVEQHGTFLAMADTDGQGNVVGADYIFRTSDGFFAVDTTNGSLVCLAKAASKYFDAANAGDYHAMVFAKSDASTINNVESPATGSVAKYGISITADVAGANPVAHVSVTNGGGAPVFTDLQFMPLDDMGIIHAGIGQACPGAFIALSGSTKYFLIFLSDALLIAGYTDNGNGTYNYWYGVGLRDHLGGG